MTAIQNNLNTWLRDDILAKADQCVYCGMCLPVCPTYQLSQQEAESPRGRLSLITAYYKGDLALDTNMSTHLDHCLLCRSCESICPAKVPFANILDNTRADMTVGRNKQSRLKRALLKLLENKSRARLLVKLMNGLALNKWIAKLPFARSAPLSHYVRISNTLKTTPQWKSYYPATGQSRDSVGLFLGCVHDFIDADSLHNTIRVLNVLGVDVHVPVHQQCCGAMHLHAGEADMARSLYQQNIQAFAQCHISKVISLSSACTATLIEQGSNLASSDENQVALIFTDICSYLEDWHWSEGRNLAPVAATVLLHYPCTQRNVLKNIDAVYTLLSRIPGMRLRELTSGSCCGAAGTYMLDYPEWSRQLKSKLSDNIDDDIDLLVTSNIGCSIQLRDRVGTHHSVEVMHPINIIARALRCE